MLSTISISLGVKFGKLAKGIIPQGVHLNRFAVARRESHTFTFCVHPGQLRLLAACGYKAVVVASNAEAIAFLVRIYNPADCRQQIPLECFTVAGGI